MCRLGVHGPLTLEQRGLARGKSCYSRVGGAMGAKRKVDEVLESE